MKKQAKYVYLFSEGDGSMKELLGGKGANLAEMTVLGMPVPQGFTVSTEACTRYYDDGKKIGDDIVSQMDAALAKIEKINGKKFGDASNPLLVSVRSGARASMPGMMDTILNLGLNDDVAAGMIAGNPDPKFARFVFDSYRRFIQMFSDVVMEIPKKTFEGIIDELKEQKGVKDDIELDTEDMKKLVVLFKRYYREQKGEDFPANPRVQLFEAVKAVFRSWDNPRANVYRKMENIPYSWGTAVNVQPMVFGNLNNNSGTGVAFTRDPATGERKLMGEYLINAQGEDVVAGIRTPLPIAHLQQDMPEVYNQFVAIANKLEKHFRDMQDMEFTIENGKLYMLQTRNGKRTAPAALRIAVDLVDEKMIDEKTAVLRVDAKALDQLLHPQFDPAALKAATPIGKGLAASPGAACGRVTFTAEDAKAWADRGETVILVRLETSPEDIEGMAAARGILTVRGGMTSHAAVVARGMGTCCVSGCGDIVINEEAKVFTLGGRTIREGDYISLDGSTGKIYGEAIPTVEPTIAGDFDRLMSWADKVRRLKVRTNADTPADTRQAVQFGAEGIGLCRTEHMFFEADRIRAFREMIVANDVEGRRRALAKILPYQQGDFEAMFTALEGRPMTVRFLDSPLHEFLPQKEEYIAGLAGELRISVAEL
ncbi:MAG: pyruvate, phosphate dikinase, partial [Oscillospiraceae bacterium]|nr:pyruvate, phosphate dikinase [Oscillospiraceae bacterium]